MKFRFIQGLAAVGLIGGGIVTLTGPSYASSIAKGHGFGPFHAVFVSNSGSGGTVQPGFVPAIGPWPGPGQFSVPGALGCGNATYTTIGAAVAAAAPGETIVVCPGIYSEDVVVPAGKPLTIVGVGNPTINAANLPNGVQVLASGTMIEGFTIGYAIGEGVLVGGVPGAAGTVSDVTISDNTVIDNDRGNPTGASISSSSYIQCNVSAAGPGDCGEGIHLLSADDSTVVGNYVTGDSGGILLSDENGPADGNLIASNDVFANTYDCGITIAGHHLGTTTNGSSWTPVAPTVGGVYNNTIRGNQSANNGVLGQGGGILLATGTPGGAVYNNIVQGNYLSGNGLAGVTVHSHSPGEDLNGNVIRGNVIATNNIDGDFDFSGDAPPAADPSTTGVIVATAVSPISITIEGNQIENDHYGLWMTPGVTAVTSQPANVFAGVAVPIFTAL